MASFLLALSVDEGPLDLPESTRARGIAALQERSPGKVAELSTPTLFAAVSGPDGELRNSSDLLALRDGIPLDRGKPMDLLDLPLGSVTPGQWDAVTGSFSVCAFDHNRRSLLMARDHFGKRPLFYAQAEGRILAASESKVLQALGFDLAIEPDALWEAILYRWVIGEWHLFGGCRQVPLGSLVQWRRDRSFSTHQYWAPVFDPEPERPNSLEEYCAATDQALRESIRTANQVHGRVGIFLSGGVDSSLIAALATEELDSVDAYVGRIPGFDNLEVDRAVSVADMLDINCQVVDIDTTRFFEDLPYVVRRLEELPRHPNNLVVHQLYEAASGEVGVVLTGDGTGTVFGHSTSRDTLRFQEKAERVQSVPKPVRRWIAGFLERIPSDRAWRLARVLAWSPHTYARTRELLYWRRPLLNALGLSLLDEASWVSGEWDESNRIDDEVQGFMIRNLLRGGTIRHDRLAQPHGVAPLSCYFSAPIWEVVRRMPRELRFRRVSKPILRILLDRYLPPEVGRWSKMGFQVPWGDWLKRELAPLCAEADGFLRSTAYLPPGFWDVSNRSQDREGIWTGLCLYLLLKEFDLPLEG